MKRIRGLKQTVEELNKFKQTVEPLVQTLHQQPIPEWFKKYLWR